MARGPDRVAVQAEPLDVNAAVAAVQDDGAGGIAMFIGTTRNHFGGTSWPAWPVWTTGRSQWARLTRGSAPVQGARSRPCSTRRTSRWR